MMPEEALAVCIEIVNNPNIHQQDDRNRGGEMLK
jgi:hypothetical protein